MTRFDLNPRVVIPAAIVVLAAVVVAVLALASGGSTDEDADGTTTAPVASSTTTSTVQVSTTVEPTTTVYTGTIAPLTGLPQADSSLLDRRVVGVKIDNHPNARPQSGLEHAEAVYEVVVEGGLTRFLALYHTSDTDYLGPMRSGRPTDASLMKPVGGVFVISGASHWVGQYIAQQGIERLGEGTGRGFRIPSRQAPHNLYVDTNLIREAADEHGHSDEPPPVMWHFGSFPEEAASANQVTTQFTSFVESTWAWTGEHYERSIGDEPHLLIDEEGEEVPFAFDGVIVLRVEQYTARPPSPSDGTPVPASITIGSGEAAVFADGRMVEGMWQRQTDAEVFELVTAEGETISVPPGRYWIALVPDSGTVEWS